MTKDEAVNAALELLARHLAEGASAIHFGALLDTDDEATLADAVRIACPKGALHEREGCMSKTTFREKYVEVFGERNADDIEHRWAKKHQATVTADDVLREFDVYGCNPESPLGRLVQAFADKRNAEQQPSACCKEGCERDALYCIVHCDTANAFDGLTMELQEDESWIEEAATEMYGSDGSYKLVFTDVVRRSFRRRVDAIIRRAQEGS